jgi:hypothetical protein
MFYQAFNEYLTGPLRLLSLAYVLFKHRRRFNKGLEGGLRQYRSRFERLFTPCFKQFLSLVWEKSMRKIVGFLVIGIILFIPSAFAEDRAVNISVSSKGVPTDASAVQKVRKITAQALAQGIVDTFYVYNPRVDGPHFVEGGLSACAEAGFNSTPEKFKAFIEQLRSVHPKHLTVYKVQQAASCKAIEPEPAEPKPVVCGGFAGRKCPEEQQYCDFGSNSQCGGFDEQGVCKSKPELCPEIVKPVCGCDGQTYGNACKAARAGVSVAHEGECGNNQ